VLRRAALVDQRPVPRTARIQGDAEVAGVRHGGEVEPLPIVVKLGGRFGSCWACNVFEDLKWLSRSAFCPEGTQMPMPAACIPGR
jgi:hypothetical protein